MKAFVIGVGGGGDAVSSVLAWHYLRNKGYEAVLGCVTWERFVIDPLPGPMCGEDFVNSKKINNIITELKKDSYAIRAGKKVIPHLVRVINILNTEGYSICLKSSPREIAEGIKDFSIRYNIDTIIGVDAGGDILAKDAEKNLYSPLTDFIMLTALVELKKHGFNVLLGIVGIGCDGELDQYYLLKRLSEIAKIGGLIDIKGYDREIAPIMEKILEISESEASRIPFEAFKGLYGEVSLRKGSRKAFASPLSAVMFIVDPEVVAKTSKIYEYIKDAKSFEDANDIMHSLKLYTEYDFELDLYSKYGVNTTNIGLEDILEIRKEGRKKLFLDN